VFAPSSPDPMSVTDDLNASDKPDLSRADKLGAPAGAVSHATADPGLKLVVIPPVTPGRVPGQGGIRVRLCAPSANPAFSI
jgi:hypothetical protein